jgi:hypothetical protein
MCVWFVQDDMKGTKEPGSQTKLISYSNVHDLQ